jgi:glycosylphosphatidylinositol transamidase (GPIT) subunit GPI8
LKKQSSPHNFKFDICTGTIDRFLYFDLKVIRISCTGEAELLQSKHIEKQDLTNSFDRDHKKEALGS